MRGFFSVYKPRALGVAAVIPCAVARPLIRVRSKVGWGTAKEGGANGVACLLLAP